MSAGHDLQRADEPLPEWERLLDVLVAAVVLVRSVERGQLELAACERGFDRLAAAVRAAGL